MKKKIKILGFRAALLTVLVLCCAAFSYAGPPPLAIIEPGDGIITGGDRDADGKFDSNLRGAFKVELENKSYSLDDIYNVRAVVVSSSSSVSIVNGQVNYGFIRVGNTGTSTSSFTFDVPDKFDGNIAFDMTVYYKSASGEEYSLRETFEYSFRVEEVFVDNIPPITSHDYDNTWRNSNFTINLSAVDQDSSISNTYYKVNGGTTQNVAHSGQPVISLESASNTLEYWSTDTRGNIEQHRTLSQIKLDKTPPVISITTLRNDQIINTSPVSVIWGRVSDTLSGTFLVTASVNDNSISVSKYTNGNISMSNVAFLNGMNTITATVNDFAGNEAGISITVYKGINIKPYQAGWPAAINVPITSPLNIADIDNDGTVEVLVNTTDKLHILRYDASDFAPYPIGVNSSVYSPSGAVVSNLNSGEEQEIIVSYNTSENRGSTIKWLSHDGDVLKSKRYSGYDASGHISMSDIDGDGTDEAIIVNNKSKIYAYRANGRQLSGWPITKISSSKDFSNGIAVGDLDNDGKMEVVACSGDGASGLYVIGANGSYKSGWPKSNIGFSRGAPVLCDLDKNGDLEIVFSSSTTSSEHRLYAFHHTGSLVSGFPVNLSEETEYAPVIGDINNDDIPEIALATKNNRVYLYNNSGTILPGWPRQVDTTITSPPIIGNIDSSIYPDIIICADDKIFAWRKNGATLSGWPITALGSTGELKTPALADLDDDGDVELLACGTEGMVYAWDLSAGYDADYIEWGKHLSDSKQTGVYRGNLTEEEPNEPPVLDSIENKSLDTETTLRFTVSATDPDGDTIEYSVVGLPSGAAFTNQVFEWTPSASQAATYTVSFIASDGIGMDSETITITVNYVPLNNPPYVRYLRKRSTYIYWYGRDSEDRNNVKYSYKYDNGSWSTPSKTRKIYFKNMPASLTPGDHTFTMKVIDTEGAESDPSSVTFTIAANALPYMQYLRKSSSRIYWRGKDNEDRYSITYSYKYDSGSWSTYVSRT